MGWRNKAPLDKWEAKNVLLLLYYRIHWYIYIKWNDVIFFVLERNLCWIIA